jgi:hypothetical protein
MIKPIIGKNFLESLKLIDPGLYLVWNDMLERYQVFHRDQRTGLKRIIFTVEGDEGNYIPCDNRTLNYLREVVAWDLMHQFPEPKDLVGYMREKKIGREIKAKRDRDDYRKQWNKAHRKYWKTALENLQRGIVTTPERFKSKLITSQGISPGKAEIILPVSFYD